jgi:hypothetical protein
MLAPVPKKRGDGGSSFATLGKYLTTELDTETGEVLSRGEVMISPALLSVETAETEMKAVAAENSRCKDAVMHFVLSWKEGEEPTSEQWQSAVKHAMDSLKDRDGVSMGDHQYMAVAHRDTENFHVHVMANRVHPETYRANSPEWFHKTLDKACREIEAEQGWQHSNGLYKWDEEKGKAIAMSREEREQLRDEVQERSLEKGTAGTGKASKMEEYGNAESLETYCKGQPAKDLNKVMQRDSVNWQDVHASLMKHGLELHKGEKGGYTVSAEGSDGERIHVKASSVFRKHFSGKEQRAATEERLGQWEEQKQFLQHITKQEKAYNQHREPKRNSQEREERYEERARMRKDLKARYSDYKALHIQEQRAKAKMERQIEREQFKGLSREAKERRAELQSLKVMPDVRKALVSIAAAEAVQSREQLRADLAEKRAQNKPQNYRTWTTERAQEGDQAAIVQLRGWHYQEGRKAKEIEHQNTQMDRSDSAKPIDNDLYDPVNPRSVVDAKKSAVLRMTWKVDIRTGDVAYQIDGKQAFTDCGNCVSFGAGKEVDAIEAGLKLAAQKYDGTVELTGTEEFKKRAVEVATERGVNIKFANKELSIYHEAYKHQVQVDREKEEARRRYQREQTQERSQDDDHDFGR